MRVLTEVTKELTNDEVSELESFIFNTVNKYVEAEHKFFDLIFEHSDQEGLTKQQAKDFITYLGNLRLYQLGLKSAEKVGENPLEWIDYILSGNTHSNFFESKVVDYSHDKLEGDVDYSKFVSQMEDKYLTI